MNNDNLQRARIDGIVNCFQANSGLAVTENAGNPKS